MINYLEKITEVYVFVSVDENGEGIIGQTMDINNQNVFMPFVCADKARLESMRPLAQQIAKENDIKIRLIKLTNREVIEEF